jgi:hypothetical protein
MEGPANGWADRRDAIDPARVMQRSLRGHLYRIAKSSHMIASSRVASDTQIDGYGGAGVTLAARRLSVAAAIGM